MGLSRFLFLYFRFWNSWQFINVLISDYAEDCIQSAYLMSKIAALPRNWVTTTAQISQMLFATDLVKMHLDKQGTNTGIVIWFLWDMELANSIKLHEKTNP